MAELTNAQVALQAAVEFRSAHGQTSTSYISPESILTNAATFKAWLDAQDETARRAVRQTAFTKGEKVQDWETER